MLALDKNKKRNWLLVLLWLLLIPAIAYVAATDYKISVVVVIAILGMATSLLCIMYYKLGFYLYITITLILPMLERMSGSEMSTGIVMDGLLLCSLLGCLISRGDPTFKKVNFLKDPLLVATYLYILVLILQIANPYGFNPTGWAIFMRVIMRNVLFLLLALNVFNNMKDVHTFFKFWIAICTAAALYACMQQWFGLMPYERAFMAKYPKLFNTTIILSGIRIYSFMSDAASFGIIMACNIVICMILLTASSKTMSFPKKAVLILIIIFHLLALGYSGTRTGYVMLPAGLMLFFIANMQKRNTILVAMAFSFCAVLILFGPFHGNPTVIRVRTAFLGKQDESVNVRDRNRAVAQPYIYSHPFGGGVMTTGGNAMIFHRGHQLANLQTDNGYLRGVLETGWLGLILMVANFYLLIQMAVSNYFKLNNELDKLLMIGIAAAVFEMSLAQYTQDASTLVESAIMLNAFTAILLKIKYLYTQNP
ncbi:O-antigen ligase family protein [Chitinophaga deserti]|uniref:O-antigen ligase family protein n=1 Tax=Chitinophaga deserti TaxID=2164099 RepID=UPI000D6C311A|nr:O-antigen ligase family protein [Chitinophaga deserti]